MDVLNLFYNGFIHVDIIFMQKQSAAINMHAISLGSIHVWCPTVSPYGKDYKWTLGIHYKYNPWTTYIWSSPQGHPRQAIYLPC